MHIYTQVHKCSSTSSEEPVEIFYNVNVDFFPSVV